MRSAGLVGPASADALSKYENSGAHGIDPPPGPRWTVKWVGRASHYVNRSGPGSGRPPGRALLTAGCPGHREVAAGQRTAQPVLVQRPGEGHSLAVRTAHRAQRQRPARDGRPRRPRLHAEIAGDPQQPAGDLVQPGGLDHALDQGAVQFEHVDGQPAQRDDRGVARCRSRPARSARPSRRSATAAAPARPTEIRGSLSASSIIRAPGGSPCRVSRDSTRGATARSSSRRAESRTATGTRCPRRAACAACSTASSSSQRPEPAVRSVSSATRRNSAGVNSTPWAERQRACASTPATGRWPGPPRAGGAGRTRRRAARCAAGRPARCGAPRRPASAARTARRGPCRRPWRGTWRGRRCASARWG